MIVWPLVTVHPLNLIGFLLLGLATLWTIRTIADAGGRDTDDLLSRLLNIAAVLMCAGGIYGFAVAAIGPTAIPLVTAGFFVVSMSVGKYLDSQRRSLLWTLSVSAQRGIPMEESARAFAQEQPRGARNRYHRLADLLTAGVRLDKAVEQCRHVLPADAELAVRFGAAVGQLAPAMQRVVKPPTESQRVTRSLVERFIYFSVLLLLVCLVTAFMSASLAPTFLSLLGEGIADIDQQPVGRLIEAAEFWWFLPLPLTFVLAVCVFAGLIYYAGWRATDLPLIRRITRQMDSALVLRCLALGVHAGWAIPRVLEALGERHPKKYLRRRLAACADRISGGENWLAALRVVGLIFADEAAVLAAAGRVGNLEWALDELADTRERRHLLKLQAAANILLPVGLVTLGLVVLTTALIVFAPTYYMLQYLL